MPSKDSRSTRRRTTYLTFEDLNAIAIQMADLLFTRSYGVMPRLSLLGGRDGLDVLNGILALPRQSVRRRAAYPGIFMKAAVLLRSMILNHPFVDGNKRMGIATTLVFLYVNDLVICATDNELVTLALDIAIGRRRELEELAAWLSDRSRSYDEVRKAVRQGREQELVGSLPGRASLNARPLLKMVMIEMWAR